MTQKPIFEARDGESLAYLAGPFDEATLREEYKGYLRFPSEKLPDTVWRKATEAQVGVLVMEDIAAALPALIAHVLPGDELPKIVRPASHWVELHFRGERILTIRWVVPQLYYTGTVTLDIDPSRVYGQRALRRRSFEVWVTNLLDDERDALLSGRVVGTTVKSTWAKARLALEKLIPELVQQRLTRDERRRAEGEEHALRKEAEAPVLAALHSVATKSDGAFERRSYGAEYAVRGAHGVYTFVVSIGGGSIALPQRLAMQVLGAAPASALVELKISNLSAVDAAALFAMLPQKETT